MTRMQSELTNTQTYDNASSMTAQDQMPDSSASSIWSLHVSSKRLTLKNRNSSIRTFTKSSPECSSCPIQHSRPAFGKSPKLRRWKKVIVLYGKVYHLWQTEKGDKVPVGPPELMTSITQASQFPDFEEMAMDKDQRLGTEYKRAQEARSHIKKPEILPQADWPWKKTGWAHFLH